MKQAPIIPIMKFENTGLSFKIHTLQPINDEQPGSLEIAHSHDHYEIGWITKDKAKLFADLQEYPLDANSFTALNLTRCINYN